jgi:hypothetical protein
MFYRFAQDKTIKYTACFYITVLISRSKILTAISAHKKTDLFERPLYEKNFLSGDNS